MIETWQRGLLRQVPPGADATSARAGMVVKLGGSLLARTDWPAAVNALCGVLERPVLLVVGGGPVVDGLRAIDAVAALPASVSHRLAIDALGITARAVAAAIGLSLTAHPHDAPGTAVLDTPRWLDDGRLAALPVGWHVTSDSIAALVAARLHRPLVLAKSVPPPAAAADLRALADAGWIDPWFPDAAAAGTRIEWATPLHPAAPRR
jgi:hypothetical protein